VNALVPQVYLPEGCAQALSLPTGGTISGDNTVGFESKCAV